MKHLDKHQDTKAIVSFLIMLVGFGLFGIFYTYQEKFLISKDDTAYWFLLLIFLCAAFLLALLYLTGNSNLHKSPSKKKKK